MRFLLAAAVTGTFTLYPGDKYPDERIEAIVQRGPIYEMIVRCQSGTAIISFSPVEKLYCSRRECGPSQEEAIARVCS